MPSLPSKETPTFTGADTSPIPLDQVVDVISGLLVMKADGTLYVSRTRKMLAEQELEPLTLPMVATTLVPIVASSPTRSGSQINGSSHGRRPGYDEEA